MPLIVISFWVFKQTIYWIVFPFKVKNSSIFSWTFSMSFIVWFLCSTHTWIPYLWESRIESKIAKYTAFKTSILTKHFNLSSRPLLLLILLLIWIWQFQVKCSSRYITIYLVCFTISIFWPLILKKRFFEIFLALGCFCFTGIEWNKICSQPWYNLC